MIMDYVIPAKAWRDSSGRIPPVLWRTLGGNSAYHSEPFVCHPEQSEGSQGKLCEESTVVDPLALL